MGTLGKEKEDPTSKLKFMALEVVTALEKSLKESLKEAFPSQKKLREELFMLKDVLVYTCNYYFEMEDDKVSFLYNELTKSNGSIQGGL